MLKNPKVWASKKNFGERGECYLQSSRAEETVPLWVECRLQCLTTFHKKLNKMIFRALLKHDMTRYKRKVKLFIFQKLFPTG